MSRGRQYIEFEGYFAQSVLGIFRIIPGFADLRDLAAVSVPYEMTGHETQAQQVVGHQYVQMPQAAELPQQIKTGNHCYFERCRGCN